jgi:hypothetical protein
MNSCNTAPFCLTSFSRQNFQIHPHSYVSQQVLLFFFLWLRSIPLYKYNLISGSPMDEHVGYFQFGGVVKKYVMNTHHERVLSFLSVKRIGMK